jgi:hypothetical protein
MRPGVVLSLLFVLLSSSEMASGKVSQQERVAAPGQERLLGIGVPSHLPLKVKVKNWDSMKWAHDLEVEVTNTSERPIYFLDFYIILPDIKRFTGYAQGFWLAYGRGKLLDFSTPLEADDVPIQPGEKYIFKIPEASAKGWDDLREEQGWPEPTIINLIFQGLNFGDGTGYCDAGGTPVNNTRRPEQKFEDRCPDYPDPFTILCSSFTPSVRSTARHSHCRRAASLSGSG